jgi:hypothetical protein
LRFDLPHFFAASAPLTYCAEVQHRPVPQPRETIVGPALRLSPTGISAAGWHAATVGSSLPDIDFRALAQGQGIEATAVDSCEALDDALRTAFASLGEPTLVEVAVD